MIKQFWEYFRIDFWVIWGLTAQGFFLLRLLIQWVQSEKEKKITVPLSFWSLGMAGAAMLLVYAIARKDLVFLLTAVLQLAIYYRNFMIARTSREQNTIE